MNLLKNLKKKFDNYQKTKRYEDAETRKIELEARAEQERVFREEYRKHLIEKAKIQAERDAVNKSGIAKMRAINQKYSSDKPRPNFFNKLSEYTKANIARREANMKRSSELRKAASQIRGNKVNTGRHPWY